MIALPHHLNSRFDSLSIALVISNKVFQVLSATPFCSGVLTIVNSLLIWLFKQNFSKALLVYSPPLSDLRVLILELAFAVPLSSSFVSMAVEIVCGGPTSAMYCLNLSNASDLYFIVYTLMCRL